MRNLREKLYASWKVRKPPSPATKTLGIKILKLSKGRAVLEMTVDQNMHNLSGTMHGGIMGDIADAAMGIALATTLEPDEDFTTIEMKMSFLRPHIKGPLRAVGVLAKRGRRVTFTEATLTNAQGEVLARSSGTCLLMRG